MFDAPEVLVAGSALGAVAMIAGVVGVVSFAAGAARALVEATSEFRGAAREDAPDGPVVGAGDFCAIHLSVRSPVLAQNICEGESHRWLRWLLLVPGKW